MTLELLRADLNRNVAERAQLLVRAEHDTQLQSAIRKMCREGTPDGMPGYLYWFKNFAYIFEPRNPRGKQKLPFLPWPYQEEELQILHEIIVAGEGVTGDPTNLMYVKTRDMGVTWIILMYFLWDFIFNSGSYLVGHRKADMVDKIGNMGTHFEKLRWQLRQQPPYLMPYDFNWRDCSKENLLRNPAGGEITGDSSNPEFGRGDRRKAILYDELPTWEYAFSAWQAGAGTTNVRIGVGTPNGPHGKFAHAVRGKEKEAYTIRKCHWIKHPLKAEGLTWNNGQPTSPWYEREKIRLNPDEVAAELDMDFNQSTKGRVFSPYGIGHSRKPLAPIPGIPVLRVWDPGLTFFVLWMQVDNWGRVRVLKEMCMLEAKIRNVGEAVLGISNDPTGMFANCSFEDCGDPAGGYVGGSGQEDPEYDILSREFGINVDWSFLGSMQSKLKVKSRIVAINQIMTKYIGSGNPSVDGPAFMINTDECPLVDEALNGGYRYKVDANGQVLSTIHEVHPYEDAIDCLGMGILYKTKFNQLSNWDKDEDTEDEDSNSYTLKWLAGDRRC